MLQGTLVERPNRFVMRVRVKEEGIVRAYCPNTSRLLGLLDDGVQLRLTREDDPSRKTGYTVRQIRNRGVWVGIEAARANDFFETHLREQPDVPFDAWEGWEREAELHGSQIDFRGTTPDGPHWVEIKSLSSCEDAGRGEYAFYSGTPSRRAIRHLEHLRQSNEDGHRASCVFVVQRPDVIGVRPGPLTDPGWLQALREARDGGVDIWAYRCEHTDSSFRITRRIPTVLSESDQTREAKP